ncbi:MAG: SDR family NAD(P)-dependent oxidoreductase [Bacillota bacterium]|jgi:NAD(P)-dependent dehydrogenase (short-subunit alcohol dehydrogenase family)|nr:SDR family NAD(P)-dependent oxidoreductase [Bacillota bacterium]HHU30910.1 SDR family NAD(P)-dependent oxidoreductase [Bacillota bacterium]
MKDFAGKICFITGGASGAGLGQAKVFGKAGMKVAIADVRQEALDQAVEELVDYGIKREDILAIQADLTDREQYKAAADKVEEVFGGPPHLLIQTAGVNSFGPIEASTFDDFDWVMGVCLDHVVNGLLIFVPRMIKAYANKTEFHVVTTSSMGAFMAGTTTGPYSAAKAAVNNLMYSYADALKPYGGGATVLCPGNIRSNIGDAEKYRPAHLRNTGYHVSEGTMKTLRAIHAQGIPPVELAEILKEGIENGRVIVLPTHDPSSWAAQLRAQHEIIEDYTLTAAEREEKSKARMAEMMKRFAPSGDEKDAPPPPPMWGVPEGGEPFGLARADLDWVDPSKKKN